MLVGESGCLRMSGCSWCSWMCLGVSRCVLVLVDLSLWCVQTKLNLGGYWWMYLFVDVFFDSHMIMTADMARAKVGPNRSHVSRKGKKKEIIKKERNTTGINLSCTDFCRPNFSKRKRYMKKEG